MSIIIDIIRSIIYFLFSISVMIVWRGIWLFQDEFNISYQMSMIVGSISMFLLAFCYYKITKKIIEKIILKGKVIKKTPV